MNFLTLEEIIFIHYRVLVEHLQNFNESMILNLDRLQSLLNNLRQSSEDKDAYSIAATLTKSLISEAHFPVGNMHIGIISGIIFMLNNGFSIEANDDDLIEAVMKISTDLWDINEIEEWFRKHFIDNN